MSTICAGAYLPGGPTLGGCTLSLLAVLRVVFIVCLLSVCCRRLWTRPPCTKLLGFCDCSGRPLSRWPLLAQPHRGRVYDLVDATPPDVMNHVAGGMMYGPLLLVLLMATVASVPWHAEESSACSEPQEEDDAVAMFALGLLAKADGGKDAQPAESPPPKKSSCKSRPLAVV